MAIGRERPFGENQDAPAAIGEISREFKALAKSRKQRQRENIEKRER